VKEFRIRIQPAIFIALSAIFLVVIEPGKCSAQKNQLSLGAYYFDGWTGEYPYHITETLTNDFSLRKPKWGWITSTQAVVDKQINLAAKYGLSFFSFCWYYTGKDKFKSEPLNRALSYYLLSKNKSRLKYCITAINHSGFSLNKDDWNIIEEEWLHAFQDENYFKVGGKPLLIIFSVDELIKSFGSAMEVKKAIDHLRARVMQIGLEGIIIAACVSPNLSEVGNAEKCGFDVLTGYNYHGTINHLTQREVPIEYLQGAERSLWNSFSNISKLKYIPVSTLNWDPRPWASIRNRYDTAPYVIGYSSNSVFNSVSNIINWLKLNNEKTPAGNIGLLYAWNEYGEGAYLTPSSRNNSLLRALRKAIKTSK